jgi:hypothetical protein
LVKLFYGHKFIDPKKIQADKEIDKEKAKDKQ